MSHSSAPPPQRQQPPPPSPPAPSRRSGGRSLRARRAIVAGVIAFELAAGLAVLAAFGGFKPAPLPQPPLVKAGQTVDTKRFDIKPLRVWRYDYNPTQDPEWADKGRFLAVELDVTLTAKDSTRFSTELQQGMRVRFPDGYVIKGIDPKSVPLRVGVVYEKNRQYAQFHPEMPGRVFVVYAMPKGKPWPSHLEVSFLTWEYAEGFLDPTASWRPTIPDTVAARVDMTVLEATE